MTIDKAVIERIQTLRRQGKSLPEIVKETEDSEYDDLVMGAIMKKIKPIDEAVSKVANILARTVDAKTILAASLSGYSGRIVCRYRPELPILVATDNPRVERQLTLSWGAVPFVLIQIVMIVLVLTFPSLVGVNPTTGNEIIEIQLPTDPASYMPPEYK